MIHKNKLLILIVGLLIIGVVSSAIMLSLKDVEIGTDEITPPDKSKNIKEINILCGDKWIQTESIEDDLDRNDIVGIARNTGCKESVSQIKDSSGNILKENKYGTISFDEKELEKDECEKDGNVWDGTKCEIKSPPEEPKETEIELP